MSSKRKEWNDFFMSLAHIYAGQSTCKRASVGCVIVSGNRQIGAGFNGPVTKDTHCYNPELCVKDGHCERAIHAEVNAVLQALQAAPHLVPGSTAYVTHYPCIHCYKILCQVGVARVYYSTSYGNNSSVLDMQHRLQQQCPEIIQIKGGPIE